MATYHSFAGSLLEEHGLRLGIEPGARLITATASAQITHRVVCQAQDVPSWTSEPVALTSAVMRLDANLAEQAIGTDLLRDEDRCVIAELDAAGCGTAAARDVRLAAQRRLELTGLVDAARRARGDAGGIDFGDQMRLCAELVSTSQDVVRRARARFRIVLLDEYQDTSIAQRVILSRLFAGTSVTAVGDPLQAIYGWRSASVANIAAFGEHFGGQPGGASMRTLTQNRRSGALILGAANRIAGPLRRAHPEVDALVPATEQQGVLRVSLHEDVGSEIAWLGEAIRGLVEGGEDPGGIAVLARTNADLPALWKEIRAHRVPAVICGAESLTASPFAAHLVAMLRVLVDPGDDAAVAAVLTSGRWQVPPADLARLGRRAREIAAALPGDSGPAGSPQSDATGGPLGHPDPARTVEPDPGRSVASGPASTEVGAPTPTTDRGQVEGRLRELVRPVYPGAQPSLMAAVCDPGPGFSVTSRSRLRRFHRHWRALTRDLDLPVAELLARVASACGLGIEAHLAAGPAGADDAGLANLLDLAVGFRDGHGRSNARAFVAYLAAVDEFETAEGAERPAPPGVVQLMTIHKAKGLEFPIVVLPHMVAGAFPSSRPSPRWTTTPHVVPVELRDDRNVLPRLQGFAAADLRRFAQDCREHDRTGEDRLAYVAITRAKRVLIASGHWWGQTQRRPRGPSDYLKALRGLATDVDHWAPEPSADAIVARPQAEVREAAWPPLAPDPAVADVAALVRDRQRRPGPVLPGGPSDVPGEDAVHLTPGELAQFRDQVSAWDLSMAAAAGLEGWAGSEGRDPAPLLPDVMTTTALMDLVRDPRDYLDSLRRPMPRRRNRHADLGSAFHAWVQTRWGADQVLFEDESLEDPDQWPGDAQELAQLRASFERTPYAALTPVDLEVPFHLSIGGHAVGGRIDAVFRAPADCGPGVDWEVVDWKTSTSDRADPLQLAIYRVAWAAIRGVPVETVSASFVHVRSGRVERPTHLPGDVALAELITCRGRAARGPGSRPRGRSDH